MNTPSTNRDAEIFWAAAALPAPERPAYLGAACGADRELRERVEVLLASHEVPDFMPGPVAPLLGEDLEVQLARLKPEEAGDRIGRYKLLQEIGEGGFGVVWMAEQVEPVTRRVALKILKPGLDSKEVIARFEQERQALAMMDHPNIAKVLDASATQWGRPYFVMELVKGIPITRFCDERQFDTRERLALFGDVCAAINHAHQKGIIHRDIKPSNVMVTLHGEKAVPKVIDFGIAKATRSRLTDKTIFTRFEQFVGTPAYMSPEQAALSGLDIDTRSDIYALGILLYELLTGKPPFDTKWLVSAGYEEMRRIIREVEPPKPSSRLSTAAGEERTTLAQARHIAPEKLHRLIEPDLDWIVMKAIEKDRSRRYETANGLALDIQRFLSDEPVSAGPPSAAYKFRKFARRNKVALATGAAIALALVIGIIGTTWGFLRAEANAEMERKAKKQAQTQAAISQAVNEFLNDLFGSASPDQEPDRDLKVRTVLDRAVARLKNRFQGQPLVEDSILVTLVKTYGALGEFEKARELGERVLELRTGVYGPEHPETIKAKLDLAISCAAVNRPAEALALREQALTLSRKVSGPEHPDTLSARSAVALSYLFGGRSEEALKMFEELLPLSRKVLGPEDPETLVVMNNLALAYREAGRPDEALKLQEQLLPLDRKVHGPERPRALKTMNNLAVSYQDVGRVEEALKLREQLLPLRQKLLGPEHPDTLNAMHNLGVSYAAAGRRDQAIPLLEEALALYRKVHGSDAPQTLEKMHNLARTYGEDGRVDDAIKLQEEVLQASRKVFGPEHAETLDAVTALASCYDDAGRAEEALKLEEEALALSRKLNGPEHRATLNAMHNLAISYNGSERLEEALKLQEQVLPLRQKVLGPEHADTLVAMQNLAMSYDEAGRRDEGTKLLEEALALCRKALPPEHAVTVNAMHNLAQTYRRNGRWDDAIKLQKEVLALRRMISGPEHLETLHAMHSLAFSYSAIGRLSDAVPLQEGVLVVLRRLLPPNHPQIREAMEFMAELYEKAGQKGEAAALEKELAGKPAPANNPAVAIRPDPAPAVRDIKKLEEALELARKTGPEQANTLTAMLDLAAAYAADGSGRKAIKLGEEALALARRTLPAGDQRIIAAMKLLVPLYKSVDLDDEARKLEEAIRTEGAKKAPK